MSDDGGFDSFDDGLSRSHSRMRNSLSRIIIHLSDDTGATQVHQVEGYPGEIRNGVQRLQDFGVSTMPLPGARGAIHFQGGHRGFGTIHAVIDVRYRPKGLKPGEYHAYIVDGADTKGNGGTLRSVVKALLGWATTIYGKTIALGDKNTKTITITAPTIRLVGNVEVLANLIVKGNLTVSGKTSVQSLSIAGVESGGGPI